MTTYTITVGDDGGQFGGYYGYYDGSIFGGTPFGSISPSGSGVFLFAWLPDGSDIQIWSYTLTVGSVITWNGQDYVLYDLGGGFVGYTSSGLGGPYPTSGDTIFDSMPPAGTVTGSLETLFGVEATFSGFVVDVVSGSFNAAIPVNASFTNIADPTGNISANIPVNSGFQGFVLPNGPGSVALVSGTSWTVPSSWNNSSNKVTCVGAGGNAGANVLFSGGGGGGGGAAAQSTNLTFTPGDVVSISVGPGLDTVFGGTTLGSCLVGAQKGGNASAATGGVGGLASASVGTVKYDGGTGGNGSTSSFTPLFGSAGGAAGPNGIGANGSTQVNILTIANGGSGDAGLGGAGGDTSNVNGRNGTEWDGLVGSGGGGAAPGGEAGYFGAGGAGGATPRSGAPGLILIEWVPLRGFTYGFIIG